MRVTRPNGAIAARMLVPIHVVHSSPAGRPPVEPTPFLHVHEAETRIALSEALERGDALLEIRRLAIAAQHDASTERDQLTLFPDFAPAGDGVADEGDSLVANERIEGPLETQSRLALVLIVE
jgi:hypothetical protein